MGRVDPARLAVPNPVRQTPGEYGHETRNVATLRRADEEVGGIPPGENVEYVVVDDKELSRDRVELVSEEPSTYDETF